MHILHQGEGGFTLGAPAGHGHSHEEGAGGGHGHAHEGGEQEMYEGGHGHGHGKGDEKKEKKEEKKGAGYAVAVDAAFLHALGDMIMSIGVCIAGTIIYFFPKATVADPICTFVFSVIVCMTLRPIVKNCLNVLMEGAPENVDID